MFQGADYSSADGGKFLLAAAQESKQRYTLHLERDMPGRPMAVLSTNVMRTAYALAMEPDGWLTAALEREAGCCCDGGGR